MRRGRARPATCGSTATAPLAREQHSRHGLCSDKSRIGSARPRVGERRLSNRPQLQALGVRFALKPARLEALRRSAEGGAWTRAPRAHRPPRTRSSDPKPTARDLHRAGCQPSVRLRHARRPGGAVLAREQVGVPLPMACSTTWRSSRCSRESIALRVRRCCCYGCKRADGLARGRGPRPPRGARRELRIRLRAVTRGGSRLGRAHAMPWSRRGRHQQDGTAIASTANLKLLPALRPRTRRGSVFTHRGAHMRI